MALYKPGESGNPEGKKPGTLNRRTQLAKLLEPHAESLVSKAIELALAGDVNMLRLCIERLIPRAKDDVVKIVIPDFNAFSKEPGLSDILPLLYGQELSIAELKNITHIVGGNNKNGACNCHEQSLAHLK